MTIDFNKYNDFLDNQRIYLENIELYRKLVDKLTTESQSEWVITKFANGKDIQNGNPIFATFIASKQVAIRIIQSKIDINSPFFNTWINKKPFEMEGVEELVISLQLRQDTYEDLSSLIEKFINRTLSNQITKFLNDKYHKLWNIKILSDTIKKRKIYSKLSETIHSDFRENYVPIRKLKSCANSFGNFPIYLVDYKFSSHELNTSIRKLKHVTENLYFTITINNEIKPIGKTKLTNKNLISFINSHYRSVKRFKNKLQTTSQKFDEELDEIEQLIS
jgi:hypothetical protein